MYIQLILTYLFDVYYLYKLLWTLEPVFMYIEDTVNIGKHNVS